MNESRMPEILLVAYGYPPDAAVGALRPARFMRYLPCFGYRATVLTAARQPDPAPDSVHYVADPKPWWQNQLWRVAIEPGLAWIRPVAAAATALARQRRFAAVVSTSPPLSAHLAAAAIQRRTGLKWVADFRDPICGDTPRRQRLTRYIDPALERFLFRRADALIANTDAAARYWAERYPQWRNKITVIWNGFDPEEEVTAAPVPPRPYRLLVHAGDLYTNRHPGPLLEALEYLIDAGRTDPGRVKVKLVGAPAEAVDDPGRFRALLARGVVEFHPWVSRAEATREVREADFLLLLDARTSTPMQVPSKIFDYIRAGRPILAITAWNSPVTRILQTSAVPHTVLFWGDPVEENARKLESFLPLAGDASTPSPEFLDRFNARSQAGELAALLDGMRNLQKST